VRNAENLAPSCAVVTKSGNLNFLEPSGPLQACNGTALHLPYLGYIDVFHPDSVFLLSQFYCNINCEGRSLRKEPNRCTQTDQSLYILAVHLVQRPDNGSVN